MYSIKNRLKSQRWQVPTTLELAIFTEFFLIPPSDLPIWVVHFALVTRGLNITGGQNSHTPILEPLQTAEITQNHYLAPWRCLVIKFVTYASKHDGLNVLGCYSWNFSQNGPYKTWKLTKIAPNWPTTELWIFKTFGELPEIIWNYLKPRNL